MPVTEKPNLHVSLIMDGNGRWAKKRFLPTIEGHRRGAQKLREVVENSFNLGITHLTVYAFSSENWARPEQEVNDLMHLLKHYLSTELEILIKGNVKLQIIGNFSKLSKDILAQISNAVSKTASNTGLTLTIAISYGSREEMVFAVKDISKRVHNSELKIDQIDENLFSKFLYEPNLPEVDIYIRTGGEKRLSNFLLWQASYAELFFINTLWPDFSIDELEQIIAEYNQRERRFGKRLAQ
ncbi:MAG: isoprenyl transferase [Sphingobacteriia bacterium]|nr:isoprenyl transferase [Sphingobacteriia bacterium]